MTGDVRDIVWRRPRHLAEMEQGLGVENRRVRSLRLRLQGELLMELNLPTQFHCFDLLEPLSVVNQHELTVLDLGGNVMCRVQRVFPDTLRCELKYLLADSTGKPVGLEYLEVTCGALVWSPGSEQRYNTLLRFLPSRWHKYIAKPLMSKDEFQTFCQTCVENQSGSQ